MRAAWEGRGGRVHDEATALGALCEGFLLLQEHRTSAGEVLYFLLAGNLFREVRSRILWRQGPPGAEYVREADYDYTLAVLANAGLGIQVDEEAE